MGQFSTEIPGQFRVEINNFRDVQSLSICIRHSGAIGRPYCLQLVPDHAQVYGVIDVCFLFL